jgi:serine/threonine protein kinase
MLLGKILSYNALDNLFSKIGDKIPLRFKMEGAAKASDTTGLEDYAREIRETFARHKPPVEIGGYIGTGGFAFVFKAKSEYGGETEFAIKILRPDLLQLGKGPGVDPDEEEMRIKDVKKRFRNESFIQWHLSKSPVESVSKSVVQVYDHGEFDSRHDFHFILMEQMGSTLRDYLKDPANLREDPGVLIYKTHMMIKIAEIIRAVHSEGVFHRDIKPENILFPRNTQFGKTRMMRAFGGDPVDAIALKLGDFGTVRWIKTYSDQFDAIIIGSQFYMSPEQILRPDELDARTDIYSFGIVGYELLYGVHPKNVETSDTNLLEKLALEKPTKRTPPKGFEGLDDILSKCMNPVKKRYQTMDEVVRDMREFSAKLVNQGGAAG